jgi:hypothetical protein
MQVVAASAVHRRSQIPTASLWMWNLLPQRGHAAELPIYRLSGWPAQIHGARVTGSLRLHEDAQWLPPLPSRLPSEIPLSNCAADAVVRVCGRSRS